jgi:hypothetical protein
MTDVLRVALLALLAATACTAGPAGPADRMDARSLEEIACSLPQRELLRVVHGYDPRRSGELQIVPQAPNFIGLNRSHSGPWDYLQEIPMFFYGPGHVPPAGVAGQATMPDVAPTLAAHLKFDLHATDGRVLQEAVDPAASAPRLVVVVVWDGGGMNVLNRHPDAWPFLKGLIPQGAWYDGNVGSSPSVTPAIHASLGTGLFPARHGLVDLRMRLRGDIVSAVNVGPEYLRRPTLADLYDRAMGNVPLVATVGFDEWHLPMGGRGALFPGGDSDIAALGYEPDPYRGWYLPGSQTDAFTIPSYLEGFPGLRQEIRRLDLEDGSLDGRWLGQGEFQQPRDILRTPAYSRYQTDTLEELVVREGFGDDDVPDLLLTNFKQIDFIGHTYGMESRQMAEVVRSSDKALADLVDLLDREVGQGEWVLALTADHGSTPPPEETGAFLIDRTALKEDIGARFDRDGDNQRLVDAPRVTQFWLNLGELEENGYNLADVARFVLRYTKAQNARDPTRIPEEKRDDLLFAAAIPAPLLEEGLPCLGGT